MNPTTEVAAAPTGGLRNEENNTVENERTNHTYQLPSHSRNNSDNINANDAHLGEPALLVSAGSSGPSDLPQSSVVSGATFVLPPPVSHCRQRGTGDDLDDRHSHPPFAPNQPDEVSPIQSYQTAITTIADTEGTSLCYHDVVLRQSDIDLLSESSKWLSDTCIEFYYEYLERERLNTDAILLMRPAMVQLVALSLDPLELLPALPPHLNVRSIVFLPINDHKRPDTVGGTHWSLMVFARCTETFYYYDTMSNYNLSSMMTAVTKFASIFQTNGPKFLMMNTPLQIQNDGNSGIHVINLTYTLCNRVMDSSDDTNEPMTAAPYASGTKQRTEQEQRIKQNWCIAEDDLPQPNRTKEWLRNLVMSIIRTGTTPKF